ncbi:MAG: spherulation-specific family 4 protein [Nitrososphaerota archaeon]
MVKLSATILTSIFLHFLTLSLIIPVSHIFALEDFATDVGSGEQPHTGQSTTTTEQTSNDDAQNVETSKSDSYKANVANSEQVSSPQSGHIANHHSSSHERYLSPQLEQTDKASSNIDRTPAGRVGTVIVKVVSSNQIDLKWTGVTDPDFSHYNIYMGIKSSFKVIPGVTVPTGTSTTNSYSSTGLNPATTYYYKIAAVDDRGNIGPLSSTRSGKTAAALSNQNDSPPQKVTDLSSTSIRIASSADTTPPAKVTGLIIRTVSSSQLNLAWNRVTASDFYHYNIYRSTTSGFTVTPGVTVPTGTSDTNSYSNTALNPSTKYSYRVAAVDIAGNIGRLSTEKSGTTSTPPDTTSPGLVSGLSVSTVSTTQINLVWSSNAASDGVDHYNVYMGTLANFPVNLGTTIPTGTTTSTTTSYSSTGLSPSTTYYYKVAAADSAGNIGPLSTEKSGTTSTPPDTTSPGLVSGLSVSTVSTTQINLVWSSNAASDGVDHYNVYMGTLANFPVNLGTTIPTGTTTSTTTSYSSTGLSPSTTYYYKVAAADSAGNIGPLSTEKSGTTSSSSGTQSSVGLYVPLYTYPTSSTWSTLVSSKNAHPNLPFLVAINPNSGVGSSQDTNFVNGIKNLKSAGIKVIGYVYTSYGQRSTTVLQDEINKYKSWYGVDGIFFDEMSNSGGLEGYYSNLNSFVKSTGMTFTMGNPGADTLSSYVGTMDTIIIYEQQGLPSVDSLKGWHTNYDKKNFSIIPYGVPSLDTQFISNVRNYVGWIYITDDGLPNPWDSLPSYFSNLVSALDS